MSGIKRAYDIMRGYVNSEWDRIRGVDYENADMELEEALRNPVARNRPEERYEVTTRELSDIERPSYARKLLGVEESASFSQIRKKYEQLHERADPSKFPNGSVEREQAVLIQRRIAWAYQVLTEKLDETEKRFRSLEIE